jgi:hypothetical protein
MTIERSMFPPRGEQCQVINFAHAFAAKLDRQQAAPSGNIQKLYHLHFLDGRALRRKTRDTPTARNLQLRLARRTEWWKAWRVTNYWRARLDWHSELQTAQRWNVGDAKAFCDTCTEERFALLALWRTALGNQMLTPAPSMEAVEWKRTKLRTRDIVYCPVKPEICEKAIADDVEWLKAHPTRNVRNIRGD